MRIVLCDDHLLLIEALASALRSRGHEVVALTTDPEAGVRATLEQRPDVCVLDLTFPQGSGLDAAAQILAARPECRILVLSARADPALVHAALAAGAAGFVLKDESVDGIVRALERVAAGEVAVGRDLLRAAVRARPDRPGAPVQRLRFLTGREREALRRIVAGESTKEIARGMGVSPSTARTHVQNVLTKLGVRSRLQAVVLVSREDLGAELDGPPPPDV